VRHFTKFLTDAVSGKRFVQKLDEITKICLPPFYSRMKKKKKKDDFLTKAAGSANEPFHQWISPETKNITITFKLGAGFDKASPVAFAINRLRL
jgi:hypothetical protein